MLTEFYDICTTRQPQSVPQTRQEGSVSLEEPLSLSAVLSLSMGTTDELDEAIGKFTGQTGLTGNREIEREEVAMVTDLPESLPVDLRAKLAVCMVHLRYSLPEVKYYYITT